MGHLTQDDHVWHTLTQAPRRMLLGHWGHEFPGAGHLSAYPHGDSWREILTEWLDHWLKEPTASGRSPGHAARPSLPPGLGSSPHARPVGRAPREGIVDYQKPDGTWVSPTSWPPTEAREEVLYLGSGSLRGQPGTSSDSFTSITGPTGHGQPEFADAVPSSYCEPEAAAHLVVPTGLAFHSDAMHEPVFLAGNPFAYLSLESSQPGGIVSLDLFDVAPGAACSATGMASAVTWLSGGGADLRFHQGSFTGRDFPTGTPTPVRVDLSNLAWTLEPDHQLVAVVTGPGFHGRMGQLNEPTITLHGDGTAASSHLVLPIVEGTLGGAATSIPYPPRPFLP